jgi:hypothetical protein
MNWICPFCLVAQVDFSSKKSLNIFRIPGNDSINKTVMVLESVACINPSCQKISISLEEAVCHQDLTSDIEKNKKAHYVSSRALWNNAPKSNIKLLPSYIPDAIRSDYAEARLISDLSPKASATLARRCLQGMIRDFCGIKKATLFAEIESLKQLCADGNPPKGVNSDTLDAIDAVRKIGNIGAHMEKDINVIIDIDQREAENILDLIDLLIDDWYISKFKREEKLREIKKINDQIEDKKNNGRTLS